jgi:hypothetical protein
LGFGEERGEKGEGRREKGDLDRLSSQLKLKTLFSDNTFPMLRIYFLKK